MINDHHVSRGCRSIYSAGIMKALDRAHSSVSIQVQLLVAEAMCQNRVVFEKESTANKWNAALKDF